MMTGVLPRRKDNEHLLMLDEVALLLLIEMDIPCPSAESWFLIVREACRTYVEATWYPVPFNVFREAKNEKEINITE